jgi:Putative Flp pilus-assembly TadE/G-like
MKTIRPNRWRKTSRYTDEAGQAIMFLILALGLALLGAVAFSVDLGNAWFHHQSAQNAADAGCTAAAMDMLVDAQGGATGHQGFTNGTAFSCTPSSTASPCVYAKYNGYNSDSTTNLVDVKFPGSAIVPGLPSSSIAPAAMVPTAFVQVNVTDNVPTYFGGLLSGRRSTAVRGSAVCGVILASSPIPILVLDPQSPNSTPPQAAFNIQGTGTIAIVGGPTKSIQVNSSATAGSCGQSNCSANLPWGTAKVDLSNGGPSQTGSDIGLYGAPTTAPSGFLPGTTGHWNAPAAPISDPFARVCAPGQTGCPLINGNAPPAIPGVPAVPGDLNATNSVNKTGGACTSANIQAGECFVSHSTHGCPDPGALAPPLLTKNNGCVLYTAGLYPSGIAVGPGGSSTAVFDPGLYYVTGGLALNSGSTVRPGTGNGDGSGGVMFYFAGSGTGAGTVKVDANSGTKSGLDVFNTASGTGSYPNGVKCTGASTIPTNLPATLTGNILLARCTGYYGDPLGASDPIGVQRGFLFFQDRSGRDVQPKWGGGGQFLLAGTMYFHSCNASGTGVGCGTPPTYYNDIFKMEGNSGSGTYVLGNIVADNLTLTGTSGITMDLNPTPVATILKATLLR